MTAKPFDLQFSITLELAGPVSDNWSIAATLSQFLPSHRRSTRWQCCIVLLLPPGYLGNQMCFHTNWLPVNICVYVYHVSNQIFPPTIFQTHEHVYWSSDRNGVLVHFYPAVCLCWSRQVDRQNAVLTACIWHEYKKISSNIVSV